MKDLKTLLYPESVAVIGASDNPAKLGYEVLYDIKEGGFAGKIYPINPKSDTIMGLNVEKSILDVEGDVDVAVIIIPAPLVPGVIRDCAKKGVKGLIIISGGFGELNQEGERLEEEIKQVARENSMRIIGPNCQGIINTRNGFCASWPLFKREGNIGIVAQSGSVGSALVQNLAAEGIGFSLWVNMGNKVDVDESDLIEYMDSDPNISIISMYLEGVTHGKEFLKTIKKAKKDIVLLKAGRTEAGRRAAQSHTKALAGNDGIWDGILLQNEVLRAQTMDQLLDFTKYLSCYKKRRIQNLFIVTSSGGLGIIACDMAEKIGFKLPPLEESVKEKLKEVLQPQAVLSNPLDLTMAPYEEFEAGAKICLEEGSYDALLFIFGDPIKDAWKAVDHLKTITDKPIVVSYSGGGDVEIEERLKIHQLNVPVYPSPERAINSLYLCNA